jgi:hypothetical protein
MLPNAFKTFSRLASAWELTASCLTWRTRRAPVPRIFTPVRYTNTHAARTRTRTRTHELILLRSLGAARPITTRAASFAVRSRCRAQPVSHVGTQGKG